MFKRFVMPDFMTPVAVQMMIPHGILLGRIIGWVDKKEGLVAVKGLFPDEKHWTVVHKRYILGPILGGSLE